MTRQKSTTNKKISFQDPTDLTIPETSRSKKTRPIHLLETGQKLTDLKKLSKAQHAWLKATGFEGKAGDYGTYSDEDGSLSGAVYVTASSKEDGPQPATGFGTLATALPPGDYHIEGEDQPNGLAWLFWLLASYRFDRYKSNDTKEARKIRLPKGEEGEKVLNIAQSVYLGRDLINTPANDLGPQELEQAVRQVGAKHRAKTTSIVGDDLLSQNFPMIHAVGRASDRAPRLIELTWGNAKHPKVTLVGKGICFDTGGLNLKPGNAMALMKKDMGGAATALSLANMIMSAKWPVRLKLLIAAADNNVSANAFRPGDILDSRNGMKVEIGNTDAEGRLVLADALSLADEEAPDYLFNFATLTGAARVALGPELPALYCDDDELAHALVSNGRDVADPLWHMPLWKPYDKSLNSDVADVNHISDGPFAGSITAALFLNRFVSRAKKFVHIDLYGWVPKKRAGFPKGGDPQSARAVFETLQKIFDA